MNKYNKESFTVGVELEFADIDITNTLPEGAKWNHQDYTIINSNGIANDPHGELYKFGGEINTMWYNDIDKSLSHIQNIINSLNPKPVINYKCNLHIHIGVPGLKDDIEALKQIMQYIRKYEKQAYEICNPLPEPTKEEYPNSEELEAAIKRNEHNKKSHQLILREKEYQEIMNSTSFSEFYEGHFPGEKGHKSYMSKRPGINMRSLKDNGTIEFRHFFGTLDLLEYKSCLTWCMEFINAALNTGEEPKDIIKRNSWMIFPKSKRFSLYLQRNFEKTQYHKNETSEQKEQRRKNIEEILQKQKVIYGSFTDEEIHRIVKDHTKPKKRSLFE